MDFLSSPPDVQLDWNAMAMRVDHDVPNSSMSPFFHFDDTAAPIPVRGPPHHEPAVVDVSKSAAAMREMVFRMAAMQPVDVDPGSVKPPPRRRNVRISKDPQSTAARHRRERISERIRTLQRLVPGGTKMDTASMLDEAVQYLKFLKGQVRMMERAGFGRGSGGAGGGGNVVAAGSLSCSGKIEQVFDYEFLNNPMHLLS